MNDLIRLKNILSLLQEMKLVTENEFLTPGMSAYLMDIENDIARYLDFLETKKSKSHDLKSPKPGIRNEKTEVYKRLAEIERKEKEE